MSKISVIDGTSVALSAWKPKGNHENAHLWCILIDGNNTVSNDYTLSWKITKCTADLHMFKISENYMFFFSSENKKNVLSLYFIIYNRYDFTTLILTLRWEKKYYFSVSWLFKCRNRNMFVFRRQCCRGLKKYPSWTSMLASSIQKDLEITLKHVDNQCPLSQLIWQSPSTLVI